MSFVSILKRRDLRAEPIFTVFVLNYGWAYAGMWQLAKRVLPNTALERILFPSKQELLEFFDEDHLLVGERA